MTDKPDVAGDKIGIGEIIWYQTNIGQEEVAIDGLSERAELCFYRLRSHYIWRAGNMPDDPSICTKMGYKSVRSFRSGLDELVKGGLVVIENGMIRFPYADKIIAEVQAGRNKKAAAGAAGGEAKAANSRNVPETSPKFGANFGETSAKLGSEIVENQRVSSSTIKATSHQLESESKPPPKTQPAPTSGMVNGNGGGGILGVQDVIDEHDRIVIQLWGEDAFNEARSRGASDAQYAAQWLELAGGSLGAVRSALMVALSTRLQKAKAARIPRLNIPGTLAASNRSMPDKIADALKGVPSLSSSSGPYVGPAAASDDRVWLDVMRTAMRNGWKDEASRINELMKSDKEAAEAYARSVRELVSSKKSRAA